MPSLTNTKVHYALWPFGQINHYYYFRADEDGKVKLTEAELDFDVDLQSFDAIETLFEMAGL